MNQVEAWISIAGVGEDTCPECGAYARGGEVMNCINPNCESLDPPWTEAEEEYYALWDNLNHQEAMAEEIGEEWRGLFKKIMKEKN